MPVLSNEVSEPGSHFHRIEHSNNWMSCESGTQAHAFRHQSAKQFVVSFFNHKRFFETARVSRLKACLWFGHLTLIVYIPGNEMVSLQHRPRRSSWCCVVGKSASSASSKKLNLEQRRFEGRGPVGQFHRSCSYHAHRICESISLCYPFLIKISHIFFIFLSVLRFSDCHTDIFLDETWLFFFACLVLVAWLGWVTPSVDI